ncbi:hypothetical protein EV363DRAFT_1293933 [Boletus edulis]|nr:hypothetical protein EV363DRAFT_1293933 [Boletus edulis]
MCSIWVFGPVGKVKALAEPTFSKSYGSRFSKLATKTWQNIKANVWSWTHCDETEEVRVVVQSADILSEAAESKHEHGHYLLRIYVVASLVCYKLVLLKCALEEGRVGSAINISACQLTSDISPISSPISQSSNQSVILVYQPVRLLANSGNSVYQAISWPYISSVSQVNLLVISAFRPVSLVIDLNHPEKIGGPSISQEPLAAITAVIVTITATILLPSVPNRRALSIRVRSDHDLGSRGDFGYKIQEDLLKTQSLQQDLDGKLQLELWSKGTRWTQILSNRDNKKSSIQRRGCQISEIQKREHQGDPEVVGQEQRKPGQIVFCTKRRERKCKEGMQGICLGRKNCQWKPEELRSIEMRPESAEQRYFGCEIQRGHFFLIDHFSAILQALQDYGFELQSFDNLTLEEYQLIAHERSNHIYPKVKTGKAAYQTFALIFCHVFVANLEKRLPYDLENLKHVAAKNLTINTLFIIAIRELGKAKRHDLQSLHSLAMKPCLPMEAFSSWVTVSVTTLTPIAVGDAKAENPYATHSLLYLGIVVHNVTKLLNTTSGQLLNTTSGQLLDTITNIMELYNSDQAIIKCLCNQATTVSFPID